MRIREYASEIGYTSASITVTDNADYPFLITVGDGKPVRLKKSHLVELKKLINYTLKSEKELSEE